MHTPPHFSVTDPADAWAVIEAHGFATLVTSSPGSPPIASPLPFLGRPDDGALISHIARTNPQLRHLEQPAGEALVVFQGPSGFVSASCYAGRDAVPTWDHMTVHVTGRAHVLEAAATLEVLADTVAHFELRAGSHWRLDTDDPYIRGLSRHVAAFRIEVTSIDATFKLSQNVARSEQGHVIAWLRDSGQRELADAVVRHNGLRPPLAMAVTR